MKNRKPTFTCENCKCTRYKPCTCMLGRGASDNAVNQRAELLMRREALALALRRKR